MGIGAVYYNVSSELSKRFLLINRYIFAKVLQFSSVDLKQGKCILLL
jgi:hypothetical protein